MRFTLFLLLVSLVLPNLTSRVTAAGVSLSASDTRAAPGRKSATLQEQLESGLKARRPVEFEFIDRVITMVDQGKLPETLVRSTFDWARKKRPYQFPYFERALKVRAAKIGIVVR